MDINLGSGMDGTQAAQIILSEKDIPLVFLSSHTEPEIVEKTLRISSYGYVVKNSGPTVLLASIRTALNLHRTREEHRKTANLLQLMFDTMTEGLSLNELVYDEDGKVADYRVLLVNKAFYKQADFERPAEPVGRLATDLYKMDRAAIEDFEQKSRDRTSTLSLEYKSAVSNRDFMIAISPVIENRFVSSFIDVTEYKKIEEKLRQAVTDKETLLKEVYHRIKNSLSSITALVDLQLSSIKDEGVRTQVAELGSRIRSIALVHQLLSQSSSFSTISAFEYLSNLLSHLMVSFSVDDEIAVDLDARGVSLPVTKALPCGLIVNEVVTNSVKYAFPAHWPGKSGEKRIRITCAEENGHCVLKISDNGVGMPANFDAKKSESLGLQLITLLCEAQLGGTFEMTSSGGVQYTITFPLGSDSSAQNPV